jgi:hypothetical protein
LCQEFPKDPTELVITDFPFDPGAGVGNGIEVVFITENRRVKRPLGTTPGATRMDSAALGIKNAVAVYGLHLYQVDTPPPESLFDLLLRKAKSSDHPPLIRLVERNRRLPLTAKSTAEAAKNIPDSWHQA